MNPFCDGLWDAVRNQLPAAHVTWGENVMQKNFDSSLKHVLVHEGGYVDHPQDPGGATNKGITLAVFRRFYGESMGKDDLRALADAQLEHIYRDGYWDKCRCDDLPDGVDYVVFDQAVNSGPGRSAKWLQGVTGVAVDGSIGPQTIDAARQHDAPRVINAMCDERLSFLKRIQNGKLWETFGRGWRARVEGVRETGVRLSRGEGSGAESVESQDVVPSVDYEVVRRGSRGEWVRRLQEALDIPADGVFGPATETALRAYQDGTGLTPDGVAGRNTYRALGLLA